MTEAPIVKVCGLTDAAAWEAAGRLGVTYGGLNFYPPSPRSVAGRAPFVTSGPMKKIGIFVDRTPDEVLRTADEWELDGVQLHGREDRDFALRMKRAGLLVVKVWKVGNALPDTSGFDDAADLFLFDSAPLPSDRLPGGTGRVIDRALLRGYTGDVRYLVGGGVGPEETAALVRSGLGPSFAGVDVNSKVESSPGIKDTEKVAAVMAAAGGTEG